MAPRCYQSLDNGQRCTATAIQGSKFCRHHDSQFLARKGAEPQSSEHQPLSLPPLVDKPSMLAAVNQVFLALGEGRIKRSVAQTLLSAIKFANRLVTEINQADATGFADAAHFHPATFALAASGDPTKGIPEHLSRNPMPTAPPIEVDPSTDRLVRELVAQSRLFDQAQTARARS